MTSPAPVTSGKWYCKTLNITSSHGDSVHPSWSIDTTASMKTSCFLVVLLLAVATGSRLSLAAREGSTLGGELGELIAKAGNFLTSAGRAGADGWHSAAAAEVDASARKGHGHTAGARKRLKKSSVNCIPADMCRRKKVLCGKRCYKTSHAAAGGLNHVPSNRCVVRCKKCVPTC